MKKMDSKSMVTQLIVLIFLINAILIIVFSLYFIKQNQSFNKFQMEQGLQKISSEKAQVVSLTMKQVENEVKNIALWVEEVVFIEKDYELPQYYGRDNRGILVRNIRDNVDEEFLKNLSNIYLARNISLSQDIINQIVTSEKLDKVFADVRGRNPYIQWAYFTTEEGLMRILPYSNNYSTNEMLASDQDQRQAPFYRFATPKANPTRDIIWTKPYLDYMGTGWMVTCSYPVYDQEQFKGVISLDVRLETLKNDMLEDFRLGKSGFVFLLSDSGEIIYHPDYIPSEGKLGDIFEFNLLRGNLSGDFGNIIDSMIKGEMGVKNYYDSVDNQDHIIAFSQIPSLGWSLGIEINEEDYLSNNSIYTYGFINILLLLILLIYLSGFVFRQYSKPLLELTKEAQQISKGNFTSNNIISNFTEIKILSDAFSTMSTRIRNYTKSLEKRNKQIETIFNSIDGLLMIVTPGYEIVTMNNKGLEKFSKNGKNIIGLPCYQVVVGKDSCCSGCLISKVVNEKKIVHGQIALEDKIFQNGYYPIINNEGQIEEIVIYSQDITERLTIEKELSQSEKMAGIGQISSAIAHELKNPLAVVKGAAYVLRAYTKNENSDVIRNIDIIEDAVTGAEKVIYNLLNFSSTSKNNYEMVNLSKIIEQIILFHRKTIIKQTIKSDIKFDPNPIVLYSNPDSLKHIFLNLITNAIDALTQGGTLSVEGSYISVNNKEKIKITVSDTGCGIPENIQREIFNPFFSTKESHSGTGLGLWITKRSILKLEGEIDVKSSPGLGTTITVILPSEILEKGE